MDPRELKQQLVDTARRMTDLADKLDKNGRPLTAGEEELCRIALTPLLTACLDELKYFFVAGLTEEFEHAAHNLTNRFTV